MGRRREAMPGGELSDGWATLCWWARGHDNHDGLRAILGEWDALDEYDPAKVENEWWRWRPATREEREDYGWGSAQMFAAPGDRGAFPVTVLYRHPARPTSSPHQHGSEGP